MPHPKASAAPNDLPDTLVFHRMPADSATAIVSFSARGGGRAHFHFFKLLEPLPNISKLLVRDPSGHWYNDGLPGVGRTVEEIAARIEEELERLGATRVVTVGSSMGGYAAILFGCLIGAERAIALGPQTFLDPDLPHSPPAGIDLQVPDLAPLVGSSPATRVDVVAGWEDLVDIFHAQNIAGPAWVRVLALRGMVHSFVGALHRDDKLLPLVTDLVDGGTPPICEVDPRLPDGSEGPIAEAVFATQRQEWDRVLELVGPIAERNPDWAGPHFAICRAKAGLDDWRGVEQAAARALLAAPRWDQPRTYLAAALIEQGRPTEAEETIRTGLELDPKWAYGHLALGRSLVRQERREEGRSSALHAVELDSKLADAAELLLE